MIKNLIAYYYIILVIHIYFCDIYHIIRNYEVLEFMYKIKININ